MTERTTRAQRMTAPLATGAVKCSPRPAAGGPAPPPSPRPPPPPPADARPAAPRRRQVLAEASGGCIRPVQLRRTDLDTQVEQVWSPAARPWPANAPPAPNEPRDRKSTRLNSS